MNEDTISKLDELIKEKGISIDLNEGSILIKYPKVFEQLIPSARTGVTARVFTHWKNEDLIPNTTPKEWLRLNLVEFIWVKFIQALRTLGVGLKEIKYVKDYLLATPELLSENPQYNEAIKSFRSSAGKKYKEVFEKLDEKVSSLSKEYTIFLTPFGSYVSTVFFSEKDIAIILYCDTYTIKENEKSDGIIDKKTQIQLTLEGLPKIIPHEQVTKAKSKPHIRISIKNLIEDFFEDGNNLVHSEAFEIMSKEEISLLELVRKNDYKEIIISKGKNETMKIEVIRDEEIREEKLKELRKILGLKDYQKITITHRNDKHAFIENKTRVII